jgi:hypothetical protein
MRDLIIASIGLVSDAVLVTAGLALLAFLWGLARFIFLVGGDEKQVDNGKNLMKWGLVALFVMVSVWGIIAWFQKNLGLPHGALFLPSGEVLQDPHTQVTEPIHTTPRIPPVPYTKPL